MSTVTHDLAYDGTAMLSRQLRRLRNNPGLLILTQTMPVTMLLFFGYVFGSALAMPGEEYRSFLVPGLLVATAANGIMTGMFQAAQDTHRGVTDRPRTLPVSRAAVPLGQSVADVLVTAAGTVPFLLVGLAVGWRVEGSVLGAVGAVGLLLLFRFATTWVGIFLGLLTRNEEAAGQLGGATFILPLLSNAYIPTEWTAWLAAHGRRVEPDQRGDHGAARSLRQRASCRRGPPGRWAHPVPGRWPGARCCSRSSSRSPYAGTRAGRAERADGRHAGWESAGTDVRERRT